MPFSQVLGLSLGLFCGVGISPTRMGIENSGGGEICSGLLGAQLAAGGIGFEATGIADAVLNVVFVEDIAELFNLFGLGPFVVSFADRVVGDEVDVSLKAFEMLGEFMGLFGAIVHASKENVFKR